MKTRKINIDNDYKKLKYFTSDEVILDETYRKYIYRYKYGISIFLEMETMSLVWFGKGEEEETEQYELRNSGNRLEVVPLKMGIE